MASTSTHNPPTGDEKTPLWYRDAIVYQIYPRSFADSNADGIGDLPGATSKLEYLTELGVDAVWLSPFYPSPGADAGYDVSNYRDVDPLFGTMDDFEHLLDRAHYLGLRVMVDLVPNHTSDEHPWFREALTAGPGAPSRERYIFRYGRGLGGEKPPNNWQSVFGGPAWTRVTEPTGDAGQWYLHLFDVKQPDLNWDHPEVRAEFEAVLRFWLDKGIDGFRVDVAHGLVKAEGLPDWVGTPGTEMDQNPPPPYFDQEGVHEIYRQWRRILDEYSGGRVMLAEAWVAPVERLMRYIRPGHMHKAFNFEFLLAGWDATRLSEVIERSLQAAEAVGGVCTWVWSNHDTVRHASRFGLSDPTGFPKGIGAEDEQPDETLGRQRARATAALQMSLPGSAYVYQGAELGLPEHTTMPDAARQDPTFRRSGGRDKGRDGARVPLPWRAHAPHYGFSTSRDKPAGAQARAGAEPWLPQPTSYARYAVDVQEGDPASTLELYRTLIRLRTSYQLGRGRHAWSPLHEPTRGVIALQNGAITAVINCGEQPLPLPATPLVRTDVVDPESAPEPQSLPPNTAAWIEGL